MFNMLFNKSITNILKDTKRDILKSIKLEEDVIKDCDTSVGYYLKLRQEAFDEIKKGNHIIKQIDRLLKDNV